MLSRHPIPSLLVLGDGADRDGAVVARVGAGLPELRHRAAGDGPGLRAVRSARGEDLFLIFHSSSHEAPGKILNSRQNIAGSINKVPAPA